MTLRKATFVDTLKIKQMILIGQEIMAALPPVEQVPVQTIPMELKKVLAHCILVRCPLSCCKLRILKNFHQILTHQQVLSDSRDCTLPTFCSGAIKLDHAPSLSQSF